MKTSLVMHGITVLFVMLLPSSVNGDLIQFNFQANWIGGEGVFVGTFGYDDSVTPHIDPDVAIYSNAAFLSGTIFGGPQAGGSVNLVDGSVVIFYSDLHGDELSLRFGPAGPTGSQIILGNKNEDVLSSSLPTDLDLNDFETYRKLARISGVDAGFPDGRTTYVINQITSVPEPATGVPLVLAIAGGLLFRSKRFF